MGKNKSRQSSGRRGYRVEDTAQSMLQRYGNRRSSLRSRSPDVKRGPGSRSRSPNVRRDERSRSRSPDRAQLSTSGKWKVSGAAEVACISLCDSEEESEKKKMAADESDTRNTSLAPDVICLEQRNKQDGGSHAGNSGHRKRWSDRDTCQTSSTTELVDVIWLAEDKQVLIILSHPQQVCLQGKMTIQSLYGGADVLGFTMTDNKKEYPLYSPDSNSLVTVQTIATSTSRTFHRESTISDIAGQLGEQNKDLIQTIAHKVTCRSVVLLVKKLDCDMSDYVTSFYPFQHLFASNHGNRLGRLDVQIKPDSQWQWCATDEYKKAAKNFCTRIQEEGKAPTVVVCGGKNVGKSSLARYLINSALNYCGRVAYMECDVGQTEFTVSGCLSLTVVTQPLLGPPFTHQRKPHCMCYFGALSPGDEPQHYIQCVQYVYSALQQLDPRLPTVINTMGWNKGLGIQLLADTLRIVQPDLVVQLQSENRYKNMAAVETEFVYNTIGWTNVQSQGVHKQHELLHIHSAVDPRLESKAAYRPPEQRSLSLLAYLSDIERPLLSTRPYRLAWDGLAIHVCHTTLPNTQILYALNASLVALCIIDKDMRVEADDAGLPGFLTHTPVCQCLGFGVVRNIDFDERVLYILSSEPLSTLQQVNCLLRGATTLPDDVILREDSQQQTQLYTGHSKDTYGATNIKPRRHMIRKHSAAHIP